MSQKNNVQVVINGQVITVAGDESSEYMQKVAAYLNDKIETLKNTDTYRKQTREYQELLLSLNLSDDYFKVVHELDKKEKELAENEKKLYDVKHDSIELQIQLEEVKKQNVEYEKKFASLGKKEDTEKKYEELRKQFEQLQQTQKQQKNQLEDLKRERNSYKAQLEQTIKNEEHINN